MIPTTPQPEHPFLARLRALNEAALVAGIAARETDDARRRTPMVGLPQDWWRDEGGGMRAESAYTGLLIVLVAWLATRSQQRRGMRDEGRRMNKSLLHPSSLIPHPFARGP